MNTRQLLDLFQLRAAKQLSQNFLLDANITNKIVQKASQQWKNTVAIEIGKIVFLLKGPGPGGLTRSILDQNPKYLLAIEKDKRFQPILKDLESKNENLFKILFGDMTQILPETIEEQISKLLTPETNLHLIGNLPFGVATVLLIQLLKNIHNQHSIFKHPNLTMTLMFQKEVADRICAQVNEPKRNRLSVISQLYCDAQLIYKVPAQAFVPEPEVDASVVQLKLRSDPDLLNIPFEKIVQYLTFGFQGKSKKIETILKKKLNNSIDFKALKIDQNARPGTLNQEQWRKLLLYLFHNDVK